VQHLFVVAKFAAAEQAEMNSLSSAKWEIPSSKMTLSVSKSERSLVKLVYLLLEQEYEWQ
jgi:hypothetical protein